jgi:hypothetical protein
VLKRSSAQAQAQLMRLVSLWLALFSGVTVTWRQRSTIVQIANAAKTMQVSIGGFVWNTPRVEMQSCFEHFSSFSLEMAS